MPAIRSKVAKVSAYKHQMKTARDRAATARDLSGGKFFPGVEQSETVADISPTNFEYMEAAESLGEHWREWDSEMFAEFAKLLDSGCVNYVASSGVPIPRTEAGPVVLSDERLRARRAHGDADRRERGW